MPKIFYNNSCNNISKYKNTKVVSLDKNSYNNNIVDYTKHFPPANKEWSNSIYAYNKNSIRFLPVADKLVIRLIKSYFYLFSPEFEKKISSLRLRIRFRRLSINRIFVSKAELKHTNSKVIITLYIYNRQKKYFLNKLKNLDKTGLFKNIKLLKIIKLEGLKLLNLFKIDKSYHERYSAWKTEQRKEPK